MVLYDQRRRTVLARAVDILLQRRPLRVSRRSDRWHGRLRLSLDLHRRQHKPGHQNQISPTPQHFLFPMRLRTLYAMPELGHPQKSEMASFQKAQQPAVPCRLRQSVGPSLGTVQDGDDLNDIAHDAIRNNIGCTRNDELACASHAARPAEGWRCRHARHH